VRYTSFDNVVEMISKLGKKAELGVIDIKSAFRLLRVHPDDFELLFINIWQLFEFSSPAKIKSSK
jgi:hypothetical protein